jgi:hypothetical protein
MRSHLPFAGFVLALIAMFSPTQFLHGSLQSQQPATSAVLEWVRTVNRLQGYHFSAKRAYGTLKDLERFKPVNRSGAPVNIVLPDLEKSKEEVVVVLANGLAYRIGVRDRNTGSGLVSSEAGNIREVKYSSSEWESFKAGRLNPF